MRIITSWDDGTPEDRQLIKLLKKYKLPAIFFVPVLSWGFNNIEIYKGFEIGCHTMTHPQDLKMLSDDILETEIDLAKELLEKKTGLDIEWFCYPRGRYDERVIKRVMKVGFKYARTTKIGIMDYPYEIEGFHCYQRNEYLGIDWVEYIKAIINKYQKIDITVHIWGHSWEINKYNEWDKLEELFKYVKDFNY